MKAVAIILSIIVFTACLVLGIQAGNSSSLDLFSGQSPDSETVITPAEQRTLLLIGVDDLQTPTPRLISLWVIFYRLDFSRVSVLPLYPTVDDAKSQEISGAFALGEDRAPSPGFLNSLQSFDFKWTSYVLIDQAGTAQLVDWLQGIEMQGNTIDGATALASLIDPWADLPGALDSQRRLGQSLCGRISQLPSETNWMSLTATLIPQHLRTDIGLEMVVSDWNVLSTGDTPLSCEFPTE